VAGQIRTYNAQVPRWPEELARAYGACEALARSHYENFPVASRLLPAPMRPHVAAVYAFARIADDMADEGTDAAPVRLARLEHWGGRLHDIVAVRDAVPPPPHDEQELVLMATAESIRSLDLPIALFDDLLSAFGQDTTTTRYATWAELFDYCRRSANPVGRLVLRIAGYRDAALDRASDALCTALQLTNFWQDFGRDWRAGRLYVPREVFESCGAQETELSTIGSIDLAGAHVAPPALPAWDLSIRRCVAVTREQFEQGRAVCDGVRGRLRFELRCTWLGGMRILDRVSAVSRNRLRERPTLGTADMPGLLWQALWWRNVSGSAVRSTVA